MNAMLQINLHLSRVAKATLCQKILPNSIGVVLVLEPWAIGGRIMGMSNAKGKILYDTGCNKSSSCIYVSIKIENLLNSNLCSRDCAVSVVCMYVGDGNVRILLTLMYLSYDFSEAPPCREMRQVLEHRFRESKLLVVGCDASQCSWGGTDQLNYRGEQRLHFTAEANLVILNIEQKLQANLSKKERDHLREEVLFMTLASRLAATKVEGWTVMISNSPSDHIYIGFTIRPYRINGTYRDRRRTNCDRYRKGS